MCHLLKKLCDTNNAFCLLDFQDPHLSITWRPLMHPDSPCHSHLTQVLGPLPLSPSWAASLAPCRSTAMVNVHGHCSFRAPIQCSLWGGGWTQNPKHARLPLNYAPPSSFLLFLKIDLTLAWHIKMLPGAFLYKPLILWLVFSWACCFYFKKTEESSEHSLLEQ